jgi:hypothetical protein
MITTQTYTRETSPHTHSENRQRTGKQRERGNHALDRSTAAAVEKCRSLFAQFTSSITAQSHGQAPITHPCDDLGWQSVRPWILPSYLDVFDLAVPVLRAKGLSTANISSAALEALIEELELYCRRFHAHTPTLWRSVRGIFVAFAKAIKNSKTGTIGASQFETLHAVPSRYRKLDQIFATIPSSIRDEIDNLVSLLTIRKQAKTPEHAHQICLKHCCATLIKHGVTIQSLSDIITKDTITILVSKFSDDHISAITILKYLHALRWYATMVHRNVVACDAIAIFVRRYRSQVAKPDTVLDAKRYVDLARPERISQLVKDLIALAETGGNEGKSPRQVALSAGACLAVLSLVTLMPPAQLPEIRFLDGHAQWHFDNCDPLVRADKRVIEALEVDSVRLVLRSFARLFASLYGRLPNSLADGAKQERNYLTALPSRLASALHAIDGKITPKELSIVMTTILIINGYSDQEAARSAGYRNLMTFRIRYAPILRLVAAMQTTTIH